LWLWPERERSPVATTELSTDRRPLSRHNCGPRQPVSSVHALLGPPRNG
jgi:hypothetical protein